MYPERVAFLRKPMRVREIVVLVRLSHSHGFVQKRNAFRIDGTAPSGLVSFLSVQSQGWQKAQSVMVQIHSK